MKTQCFLIPRGIAAALLGLSILTLPITGCATRAHLLTGEPVVTRIHPLTGELMDRDIVPAQDHPILGVVPHRGEIISLVLNHAFIRNLQDLGSPHVLVYAEVLDDGSDDPAQAVSKVLFNGLNQPQGVSLGLSDRILYGPTAYKGYPLRIKLYIVELDKEDKAFASKIIQGAASLVTGTNPAAAPAVGIAVRIAEAINELNADDYELRFDMTLYPVAALGLSTINDPGDKPVQVDKILQRQREGQPTSLLTSLRTGAFVVTKRELAPREEGVGGVASTLQHDWAQKTHLLGYVSPEGKNVEVESLLRMEGGHLYSVVRRIRSEGKEVGRQPVIPGSGPNRGQTLTLVPGYRIPFDDQTHVVLSIVTGLPEGIDQNALRAGSDRDVKQMLALLDNPGQVPLTARLSERVDDLTSSVKVLLETRRLADQAARRVGRDPGFRTSNAYPHFWSQQLVAVGTEKTVKNDNASNRNTAILTVLGDLLSNLPPLEPSDQSGVKWLQGLSQSDFETAKDTAGTPLPGQFQISAAGLGKRASSTP